MNERAVCASAYPNANIIIIRRESGRSLTLRMHALHDAARCIGGGSYAPVRRFTLDLDRAKRTLGRRRRTRGEKKREFAVPSDTLKHARPESRPARRAIVKRGNELADIELGRGK